MAQKEYVGEGEISKLSSILNAASPKRVLLVTGKSSYANSGAATVITDVLADIEVLHYRDFGTLPLEEDIQQGVQAYKAFAPDFVVAVGGGHVIDFAKAVNYLTDKKPLVAVPTTSGTGSESTQFAVVYKNGVKTSLESPDMLPAFAIVDPELSMSVPREVAIPSALDALCQAIESYWSNKATDESRSYSLQALEYIWPNLNPAIEDREQSAIAGLCLGAHLSGKAINIAKTTACHAFSYGLTYRFGVPHGIAVAMFLPEVYRYNSAVDATMSTFRALNATMRHSDSRESVEAIGQMLKRFNVVSAAQFGVKEADIEALALEVNADRLKNNPREIRKEDIINFFQKII